MDDFEAFLEILKSKLARIAEEAIKDISRQLLQDGTAFAQKTKEDLQRWAALLKEGRLTREEVAYLLQAKSDLAEMEALKQKGLSEVRIDELRHALLGAVVESVVEVLR